MLVAVPKIIHQIAPKDETCWHPFWHNCQQSWLEHFSDFEYKLWNDQEDINNFVLTQYPQFANLYNNFPVQIMRIDFARLCILYHYGGIYGDMDYFVYKNFYSYLSNNFGFIENLTEEYTSAIAENSLMYSTPGNKFILECMNFCKMCFIHFTSQFKKSHNSNWRTANNDFIVNNTTGSGMLTVAFEHYQKFFDIQLLPTQIFNNRPASYDSSFIGKHVHSSIWGNEYLTNNNKIFIKKNGAMGFVKNVDTTPNNNFLNIKDFDFFTDYTKGQYLKKDNLNYIKELVKYDS